jgi:hypothetical protein
MKYYSVVYLAEGEEELVSIWEKASDRALIANAANVADQHLATSPQSRCVHLGEDLWKLDVDPLRFYFAIREQDLVVEVANVILITS